VSVQDIVLIQWMLEHGAEVNKKTPGGHTALHEACNRRCDEDVELKIINALLACSADVDARDESGRSPADLYREYNRRSFSEDFPQNRSEQGGQDCPSPALSDTSGVPIMES